MKPKKDNKVFRRTAAKSKKININPTTVTTLILSVYLFHMLEIKAKHYHNKT